MSALLYEPFFNLFSGNPREKQGTFHLCHGRSPILYSPHYWGIYEHEDSNQHVPAFSWAAYALCDDVIFPFRGGLFGKENRGAGFNIQIHYGLSCNGGITAHFPSSVHHGISFLASLRIELYYNGRVAMLHYAFCRVKAFNAENGKLNHRAAKQRFGSFFIPEQGFGCNWKEGASMELRNYLHSEIYRTLSTYCRQVAKIMKCAANIDVFYIYKNVYYFEQ